MKITQILKITGSGSGVGPDPLVRDTDPRIRIRTEMSRIRNADMYQYYICGNQLCHTWEDGTIISTVSLTSSMPWLNPSSRSFSKIRYWAFHWDSGVPTTVTLRRCSVVVPPPAAGLSPPVASVAASSSAAAILTDEPENLMIFLMWLPLVPRQRKRQSANLGNSFGSLVRRFQSKKTCALLLL